MLRFAARTQRLAVSTTTLLAVLSIHPLIAETVSPLTARGYTVLPVPQRVELGQQDFAFTDGWQLVLGPGIRSDDVALESLNVNRRRWPGPAL